MFPKPWLDTRRALSICAALLLVASTGGAIEIAFEPVNRSPVVERVVLVPQRPITTDTIEARYEASDPDGDSIVDVRYEWRLDGETLADVHDPTLDAEWTARGAQVEVRVKVSDGELWSEPSVSAPVVVVNAPPELTAVGGVVPGDDPLPFEVAEGETLELLLEASDPDGDALVPSAVDLPPGATLNGAVLRWTPTFDQAGSYPPTTLIASDGELDDRVEVRLSATDVNRAPVLSDPGAPSLLELDLLELDLEAVDPDGDTVELSVAPLPEGATFDPETGRVSWTPSLDQAGSYTWTVTATDARPDALSSSIDVTVEVGPLFAIATGDGLRLGFDADGRLAHFGRDGNLVPAGRRGGVSITDLVPADGLARLGTDVWSLDSQVDARAVVEDDGSLRLRTLAASGEIALVSELIAITEDDQRLEFEARTANGFYGTGKDWDGELRAEVSIRWLGPSGELLGESTPLRIQGPTSSWRAFGTTVAPAEGATDAAVVLSLDGAVPRTDSATTWIREIRLGTDPVRSAWPVGSVSEPGEGRLSLRLEDRDLGYRVEMIVTAGDRHFEIDGRVVNRGELAERALDLSFSIPVPRGDWRWWDDPHTARTADQARIYAATANLDEAAELPVSLYPLGLAEDGERSVALGWPFALPYVARVQLDADQELMSIVFALGVSDATARFPSQASFDLVVFAPTELEWGLRAAFDDYYAIDPPAFEPPVIRGVSLRTSGEGLHAGQTLTDPADFNIRYVLSRHDQNFPGSLQWIHDEGLTLAHYTRPWDLNVSPWPLTGPPPDYASILDEVYRLAEGEDVDAQLAAAGLESLAVDTNGDIQIQRLDEAPVHERDAWTARLPLNLDPELPGEGNTANLVVDLDLGTGLDGVREVYPDQEMAWFMDGVATSARLLDSSASRIELADGSLTYSSSTRTPAGHLVQRDVEFLRWANARLDLREPDLYTIGNLNDLSVATHVAPFIDFHVYEADPALSGPDAMHATRIQHRFLARYRPLTEIYQPQIAAQGWSSYEEFEAGYLRPEWHAMMLYGIHPSALSQAIYAGVDVRPARDLYLALVPTLLELQTAGWEPLTHADTDDPELRVERFGAAPEAFVVVHNGSDVAVDYALEVDARAFGFTAIASVREQIEGTERPVVLQGGRLRIDDDVAPTTSRVFRLRAPADAEIARQRRR